MTPWERPEAWRGLRVGLGVVLAGYLALVAATIAGGSLAAYPLMHPDSYEWLINGLRYTGMAADTTWRSVLAPLVYAGLFALGLENLIPLLGLAVMLAMVVLLLTLGWRAAGVAALWTAALVTANHLVLGQAVTVQPDLWSAGLGLAGILALAVALDARDPGLVIGAMVAFALGGLAQPATPFLAPACLVMLLYDPEARWGVGAGTLRWLARQRETWCALALAVAVLLAPPVLRWLLAGEAWPDATVPRLPYVRPRILRAFVGFYAWVSVADWSVPVTLLAGLGAVRGLQERSFRRLTLGLLGAIAGNAGMFALVYTMYRENRFVLYWTLPALFLAGIGLRSLRPAPALVVGLLALAATNLTALHWARPGAEPLLIVSRDQVFEARYGTEVLPWEVERIDAQAHGFRDVLARWVGERRRLFARLDADDVYYSRTRDQMGQLATSYVRPGETLYLHFGPDEHPTHVYIMRQQLTLYARRRARVFHLDAGLPGDVREVVVLLRRRELDRLAGERKVPGRVEVLAEQGPYVLVRVVPYQPPTPASSRKMSSMERVRSQLGKSAFSRRRSLM